MTSVNELWVRIENALKHNENYHDTYVSLGSPALTKEIQELKDWSSGYELPDDLISMYAAHNGANDRCLFRSMLFHSCGGAIGYSYGLRDALDIFYEDGGKFEYIDTQSSDPEITYETKLLPIGTIDNPSITLSMELGRNKGTHGRLVCINIPDSFVLFVAPSITSLMSEFAEDIEAGRYNVSQEGEELALQGPGKLDIGNYNP